MLNKKELGIITVYDGELINLEVRPQYDLNSLRDMSKTESFKWFSHRGFMLVDIPLDDYISIDNDFKIYDKLGERAATFSLINENGKSYIRIMNESEDAIKSTTYYDLVIEWEEPSQLLGQISQLQSETTSSLYTIASSAFITQKLTRSEYVYLHTDLWDASQMLASFPLIKNIIKADTPIIVVPFKLKNGLLEFDLVSGNLEVISANSDRVEVKLLTKSAIIKLTTLL